MFPIRTIIALAALAGPAAHGETLRSSDVYPADYPTVQAVAYMDKLVRERTAGRHSIERLGQNDQDSERYTIAELQNGTLDMARVNLEAFDRMVTSAGVSSIPYLFRSTYHMRRVLDGPIGAQILADMEDRGIIGLCFYDMGARSYGATRPIRSVADIKGLKVAVQRPDIWTALLRAQGAAPVTMPIARTYAALRAGAVDAAESTLPAYVAARHYEAARFYSLTEHSMAPGVLVFSKKVWDRLARGDQTIIRAAARESVPYMRKVWDEYEALKRLTAEAAGAEIVIDVDQKSFADALEPIYPALLTHPRLRDLVSRIQATN